MDIAKFNWSEMFNNSKGKTSGSLFCGVILIISGAINIALSVLMGYLISILEIGDSKEITSFSTMVIVQSLAEISFGGALLGIHRLSKDKSVEQEGTLSSKTETNTTSTTETKKTEETSV